MFLRWSLIRLGALAVLAAASVVLGIVIYDEIAGGSERENTAPAASSRAAAATATQIFSLPPLQSYHVVTERPLFTPGRHPAPLDVGTQPAGEISSLVLNGIIVSGDDKIALITDSHGGSMARYREGQMVAGWTLQSIERDHVVLERGASRQEIKLIDKPRAPADGAALPRRPQRLQPAPN